MKEKRGDANGGEMNIVSVTPTKNRNVQMFTF